MTAFSVSPITDIPPPTAQEFPNFIQFQNSGEDLGGPDADTLNFADGLTATRGTGENSNVVTVVGSGGGGETVGLLTLTSPPDPQSGDEIMKFDGVPYQSYWGYVVTIPSANWEWVDGRPDGESYLHFINAGIYRLLITCWIDAEVEWPNGDTTYGSMIGNSANNTSAQARSHVLEDPVDTRSRMQWTDQVILEAEADSTYMAALFAQSTDFAQAAFAGMRIGIERIATVEE